MEDYKRRYYRCRWRSLGTVTERMPHLVIHLSPLLASGLLIDESEDNARKTLEYLGYLRFLKSF